MASIEYYSLFFDLYEWVPPNRHQRKGYWRLKPYTRLNPSISQLKCRLSFAQAAFSATDEKGRRTVNDKEVPPAALRVKEVMEGERFVEPKKPRLLPFPMTLSMEEVKRKVEEALARV